MLSDWVDYLIIIFFEVCIKKFMEMCGVDGGLWWCLCVLFVYWVGLMYDSGVFDVVWDIVKEWDVEICEVLCVVVLEWGLVVEVNGIKMIDFVCEIVLIVE